MNKILLVIQREYATRVKKPSFWILTVLVPLLLAGVYAIPIALAMQPPEHINVLVTDESGLFQGEFKSSRSVTYYDAGSLAYARRMLMERDTFDAILYIPAHEATLPSMAYLYYRSDVPPAAVQAGVSMQLQEILRNRLLMDVHGITPEDYAMITATHIRLRTQDIETGRDGMVTVKVVVGALLSLLVFMAVFMFGSQVMRGVMEEKTNRIVEVIVCSVKPFQLMMGKVVGIGLVGLTQFALWVVLSGVAMGGVRLVGGDIFKQAEKPGIATISTKGSEATTQYQAAMVEADRYEAGEGLDNEIKELIAGVTGIDFGVLASMFLFYFVFGYLLYASMFAAAGSLVDNDTDSQQFTLPLTIPLLLCVCVMPAMASAPSGALSVWLSMIPFTSPAAMIFRIPFGVPMWQLALSMLLLVAAFPLCTWGAAKIYRQSILRYGKTMTWRDVWHHLSARSKE